MEASLRQNSAGLIITNKYIFKSIITIRGGKSCGKAILGYIYQLIAVV
jgi:hypothetical protein